VRGFDFKIGERYLVFAHSRATEPRLRVSRCSRTRKFDGTGEDAEFLASLSTPETGEQVFGSIDLFQWSLNQPSSRTPMNLPVRLTGNGRTITTTAKSGRYRFSGLAAGQYGVEIDLPPGYSTINSARSVDIPNARACAQTNYSISPAGSIAGRLVDKAGQGVRDVRVEVTAEDARVHPDYGLSVKSAQSDADGYFDVRNLSPGRYIVGVNLRDLPNEWNPYARQLYPGQGEPSAVIELTLGQVAGLGQWALAPPLAVVPISGWIVWKDGTPAGGVYVALRDMTGNPAERARAVGGSTSGPDGRFVIQAREGRAYTFMARPANNGPFYPLTRVRIEARPGLEPVRLVIEGDR
jgi:hypothetical protein